MFLLRKSRYFCASGPSIIDKALLLQKSSEFCGAVSQGQHTACRSSFSPSLRDLSEADRLFRNIGPKTALAGSFMKIYDEEKLEPLPEIALVGRTSVGKSSLINALLNQKKLARTSKRPGHTRHINLFNVGSRFHIVDLPGYGYVERVGPGSHHFVQVVERYLKQRTGKQLKSVCLLIDGEVGIKINDLVAIEMLEEFNTPFQIVLTKMDKVSKDSWMLVASNIQQRVDKLSNICYPHVFPISVKDKTGLSELRYFLGLNVGIFY
ncbi:probable GTP-binding protein EngB [Nematostella vectensis]|uniref:probable GTP-binding protein EngB n=1 Tax=Nematostella vectensis TaxID=45351 RepID=UPI002076E770|nr:probable GTP-binding protein EngB [Nematostella vectensis]